MTEQIEVHCPCGCAHHFKVPVPRSKRGEGAAYAAKWERLPPANMHLLVHIVNNYPLQWWEKKDLYRTYKPADASVDDPLSARVSELLWWKFLEMKRGKVLKQQKYQSAFEDAAYYYRLNLIRASMVISSDGRLDTLKSL